MQVEWWQIDRPKPYEKNARKIPQKAIDKVALSLRTFGWQQPISVDVHDVIVAGHTRLLAAQQEKHTKVPVVIASNLTPAQIRAYRIMDNRSHQETEWDDDILGLELGELKALDLDLAFTGVAGAGSHVRNCEAGARSGDGPRGGVAEEVEGRARADLADRAASVDVRRLYGERKSRALARG